MVWKDKQRTEATEAKKCSRGQGERETAGKRGRDRVCASERTEEREGEREEERKQEYRTERCTVS